MKWKIPLYKVFTDKDDIVSVSRVIKRGYDWAIGPEIEQFEKLLANYVGSNYCVTFNSGTSALHASLLALGIKSGNGIAVPSFTFIATVNSVLMVNAVPQFVDIEEKTLGMDPTSIQSTISQKTKLLMPVHYAGLPCRIEEIAQIAKRKKIFLIEDAAESFGAKIKNRMIGTYGDLSIFSFAPNKIITTGEGGCVTTNSKKLFEKLKLIRSHGRFDKQNYFSSMLKPEYVTMGYNWRMSSMTAALGISQLEKLDKLIKLRQNHAQYVSHRLKKHKEITVPSEPANFSHVYQLYSIRLKTRGMRNMLMNFLASKGIMSKVFFNPVHLTDFYKNMGYAKKYNLPVTEKISNQILTLPMYPGLQKEDLNFMCDSIDQFMENN